LRYGIFRGGRPGRTTSQQGGNRRQADTSPHRNRRHGDRTALAIGQSRSGLRANGREARKIAAPAQGSQSDETLRGIETQARRGKAQRQRSQTSANQMESGKHRVIGYSFFKRSERNIPYSIFDMKYEIWNMIAALRRLLPRCRLWRYQAQEGNFPSMYNPISRSKSISDSLSVQDVLRDR
jgi:hypothetical protein